MLNSCKCCFGMSGPISSRQCAPLELHLCNKWSFKSWMYVALGSYNGITSFLKNVHLYYCQVDYGLVTRGSLVTQPMLQPTPNQTELRLIVSKSFFNVDSKNVSKKFLHHHSWKKGFFQEWRWRNFSLTFLESTLKKDLETINLSSVWFGVGCNIGWVTSDPA